MAGIHTTVERRHAAGDDRVYEVIRRWPRPTSSAACDGRGAAFHQAPRGPARAAGASGDGLEVTARRSGGAEGSAAERAGGDTLRMFVATCSHANWRPRRDASADSRPTRSSSGPRSRRGRGARDRSDEAPVGCMMRTPFTRTPSRMMTRDDETTSSAWFLETSASSIGSDTPAATENRQ